MLLPHACVQGAAIEDKLFPKTNSLLDGRAQPLADVEEFALKIKVLPSFQHRIVFIEVHGPEMGGVEVEGGKELFGGRGMGRTPGATLSSVQSLD